MSERKRVLLLGSYAPSLVHFRGPLIAAMVARCHQVVAAAPEISPQVAGQIRALGAEPRDLPLVNASLNPLAMMRSYRQLRAMIASVRPDVLISYTIKPVILGAIAGRRENVPTVVSLITGVGYAFTGGREAKRLAARVSGSILYRTALSLSDRIVFQNPDDEALFRRLRLLRPAQPSFRVNGSGIDLEAFAPAELPSEPAFLMIARLLKDKGIREFAAAAKRVKAAHPDVPITLVGYLDPSPDSLRPEELDELIACGIDYRGRMDDVRPAIADASVYVLPSYREGTPRSVLEAMAMGRPIITTDAPGCRETVVDGRNGFLVPVRDSEALYRAMQRFIDDPGLIQRMGPESRAIAERKFDVVQVNRKFLDHVGL